MAVDLKRLFNNDDAASGRPPVQWSDTEAARAVDDLFLRLGVKIPIGFAFTCDDWQGLAPMEHAIGVAREEQDAAGLARAIRAYEDEAGRMLQRRKELFDVLDSLRDW
jgi:hypothetical protein